MPDLHDLAADKGRNGDERGCLVPGDRPKIPARPGQRQEHRFRPGPVPTQDDGAPRRWRHRHTPAPGRGTGGARSHPGGPGSAQYVGGPFKRLVGVPVPKWVQTLLRCRRFNQRNLAGHAHTTPLRRSGKNDYQIEKDLKIESKYAERFQPFVTEFLMNDFDYKDKAKIEVIRDVIYTGALEKFMKEQALMKLPEIDRMPVTQEMKMKIYRKH